MSLKLSCPSCGAELIFQSAVSIMSTCSFCQSLVLRRDLDVESLGKTSLAIEDMSVIQLGSRGKYLNISFSVVGRIQLKWDGGFWNEWFVAFEDGKSGWLAEAQGSLMMSFLDLRFRKFRRRDDIAIGDSFQMSDTKYYFVKDIRKARVCSILGELPFAQRVGQEKLTYDLSSEEGGFATFDYDAEDKQEPTCYLGKWQTVQSLNLSSLREFEGWSQPSVNSNGK